MLTPQEVQDKRFPKAVFGGYDMGEVDDFLDSVSADYSSLYKENVVLKNKLKVLAEKVEEYRSVDAAMRKALLGAQKMANKITEEAKEKSEELRGKAQLDYENSMAALKDNIKNEELRLEMLREESNKFAKASILIYNRQIDTMKRMVSGPVEEKLSPVDRAAEDIEKNFNRAFKEEKAQNTAGNHVEAVVTYRAQERGIVSDEDVPVLAEHTTVVAAETIPVTDDGNKANSGYNNNNNNYSDNNNFDYDLSKLFSSEGGTESKETQGNGKRNDKKKDSQGSKDVNVGGMNVRVFEMDLSEDKRDDITL